MSAKKIRVLVLAEAANPEWTSVPLIGWLHTQALAKVCDVHLVTQLRNKNAIEKQGWKEGIDFTSIDTEKVAAPIYKLAKILRGGRSLAWTIDTALGSLTYPVFENLAWRKFKADLIDGKYDIVHRITPVSPTTPSIIAKRLKGIGVPFIVGPLNGGVPWPAEFRDLMIKEREWLNFFKFFYKFLPGYRSMRNCSSAILVGSKATEKQMKVDNSAIVHYLPENAVDTSRFNLRNQSTYQLPLKAAFVGRLVPYKGADMAIEAIIPFLKSGLIEYDIYGDGPELSTLESIIQAHELDQSVRLHGFVANADIQKKLVKSDLLVFPSIREFGGGVVLESMALGLVPVIVDYAGPSELVTDDCGYKVPLGNRETLISGLRKTINSILQSPQQLVEKRLSALETINKHFTWDRKVRAEMEIYREIIKNR